MGLGEGNVPCFISRRMRLLELERRVVHAAIAVFVALVAFAMRAYPGGTSWDASAPGHHFWLNYLCDLARPTALNGVPNPTGSAFARAAMVALAIGLLPWWSLLARLTPSHPRTGRVMRALGLLATVGIGFVVALPGDRFGRLHALACVASGVPGLAAAVLAVVALFRDAGVPRPVRWLGAVTLMVSATCFALYLPDVLSLTSGFRLVAVLERVSIGLLLFWMLAGSSLSSRPGPPAAATKRGLLG